MFPLDPEPLPAEPLLPDPLDQDDPLPDDPLPELPELPLPEPDEPGEAAGEVVEGAVAVVPALLLAVPPQPMRARAQATNKPMPKRNFPKRRVARFINDHRKKVCC